MRRIIVPAAVAAVIAVTGVGIANGAPAHTSSAKRAQLVVKDFLGPQRHVAPGEITGSGTPEYKMFCPAGSVLTGVGFLAGANDVVYATPAGGREADFSFANPSDTDTFDSAGSITCAKGKGALKAKAAVSPNLMHTLKQQAREALR